MTGLYVYIMKKNSIDLGYRHIVSSVFCAFVFLFNATFSKLKLADILETWKNEVASSVIQYWFFSALLGFWKCLKEWEIDRYTGYRYMGMHSEIWVLRLGSFTDI